MPASASCSCFVKGADFACTDFPLLFSCSDGILETEESAWMDGVSEGPLRDSGSVDTDALFCLLSLTSDGIVEVTRPLDLSDVGLSPRESAPTFLADAETAPALDSVAASKPGLL